MPDFAADDGFHFIPKSTARLNEPYVDIRHFTIADWEKHQSLAMALVQAQKGHVMQGAATETVRQSFDDMLGGLTGPRHR